MAETKVVKLHVVAVPSPSGLTSRELHHGEERCGKAQPDQGSCAGAAKRNVVVAAVPSAALCTLPVIVPDPVASMPVRCNLVAAILVGRAPLANVVLLLARRRPVRCACMYQYGEPAFIITAMRMPFLTLLPGWFIRGRRHKATMAMSDAAGLNCEQSCLGVSSVR